METQERIEEDSMAKKSTDGKDELNLAEFPLCALANRLRPDQKTLRFEDRLWDDRRKEERERSAESSEQMRERMERPES